MAKGLPNLPTDALASYTFAIEIDRTEIAQFSEVSGLASEVDVIELKENTPDGKLVHPQGAGRASSRPTLDAQARQELVQGALGLARGGRCRARSATHAGTARSILKSYDGTEVARYNFTNAWVSKISTGHAQGGRERSPDGRGLDRDRVDRAGLVGDAQPDQRAGVRRQFGG